MTAAQRAAQRRAQLGGTKPAGSRRPIEGQARRAGRRRRRRLRLGSLPWPGAARRPSGKRRGFLVRAGPGGRGRRGPGRQWRNQLRVDGCILAVAEGGAGDPQQGRDEGQMDRQGETGRQAARPGR